MSMKYSAIELMDSIVMKQITGSMVQQADIPPLQSATLARLGFCI